MNFVEYRRVLLKNGLTLRLSAFLSELCGINNFMYGCYPFYKKHCGILEKHNMIVRKVSVAQLSPK